MRKFKTGKPEIAREDCRFAERLASSRFDFSAAETRQPQQRVFGADHNLAQPLVRRQHVGSSA